MGLFSRKPAPVVVDDLLGHAPAHRAAQLAARSDLDGVSSAHGDSRGESRSLVLEAVRNHLPLHAAQQVTSDAPADPDAWLCLGTVLSQLAGEARGDGQYETLGTGQVLDFGQLMSEAEHALVRSAELDARDPEPVRVLLETEYALGGRRIRSLVENLRSRDQHHVLGLRTATDLLAQKWNGEPGEARAFAEDISAAAPQGSAVHQLVPAAIAGQWLQLLAFDELPEQAAAFYTREDTRAALSESARRSVTAEESPLYPRLRNELALGFHLAGMRREAGEQFAALDGLAVELPWNYLGPVFEVYRRAAQRAK